MNLGIINISWTKKYFQCESKNIKWKLIDKRKYVDYDEMKEAEKIKGPKYETWNTYAMVLQKI